MFIALVITFVSANFSSNNKFFQVCIVCTNMSNFNIREYMRKSKQIFSGLKFNISEQSSQKNFFVTTLS